MTLRICTTCGVQQPVRDICPICEDERQFVPEGGQKWTDAESLRRAYKIAWREEAPGILSLEMQPEFGIGQRAFLIIGPRGNILWDCVALLDDATRRLIKALGGLSAIAISHPHYYSTIADWGRAFDVPVYVHADDREWIQQPDDALHFWQGETLALDAGATIIRCGGHFDGASVLHVPHAMEGRGALFSGDTIQVVYDRRHVSFMRSYPNLIPLSATTVRRIVNSVEPYQFDAVFGAFAGRTILADGKQAIRRSADRYVAAISEQAEAERRTSP